MEEGTSRNFVFRVTRQRKERMCCGSAPGKARRRARQKRVGLRQNMAQRELENFWRVIRGTPSAWIISACRLPKRCGEDCLCTERRRAKIGTWSIKRRVLPQPAMDGECFCRWRDWPSSERLSCIKGKVWRCSGKT